MPDETSLRPAHAVFHRGETRLRLTNALLLPAPYIARREQETGVFIDVDGEVLMWEGLFEQPDTYKTDMLDSLGKIGNTVPETIELGDHLCYSSPRDEHVVQPRNLAVSVEIANGIPEPIQRPVQCISYAGTPRSQ